MQVKKEEMRQKIIETATDEFIKRGYENASLRVIAQKSHTTLGNIYHYFKNKEVLLETILLPVFDNIDLLLEQHYDIYHSTPFTKQEMIACVNNLETYFEESELRCFFDKRIVIILKLESSKLLDRKEKILSQLHKHLQEHFSMDNKSHYPRVVLEVLADCLKHALIEHENMEDAKADFISLFKVFCTGIIGQME